MNLTTAALAHSSTNHDKNVAPLQLTTGPSPVPRQRPAICEWADRLADAGVDAACQGVALQLASYANKHGGCFPTVAKLAKRVGLAERQCRRHLNTLARKGLIEIRRRALGHRNAYKLNGYGWNSDRSRATGSTGHVRPVKVASTKKPVIKAARQRCAACGYSWPSNYGATCFQCLKAKRDAPRRPNGGAPTYHDRPPRESAPLTAEQRTAISAQLLATGWQQKGTGQWARF